MNFEEDSITRMSAKNHFIPLRIKAFPGGCFMVPSFSTRSRRMQIPGIYKLMEIKKTLIYQIFLNTWFINPMFKIGERKIKKEISANCTFLVFF